MAYKALQMLFKAEMLNESKKIKTTASQVLEYEITLRKLL